MRNFMHIILAATLSLSLTACGSADQEARSKSTTAPEVQERLKSPAKPLVVDVREPSEFESGHINGAVLVPLGSVEKGLPGVDKDREIVLVCRSGRRSGKAQEILAAQGYTKLQNMEGGMLAWEKLGYPVVK
jgi:rhodanese-related sulfurtransferase